MPRDGRDLRSRRELTEATGGSWAQAKVSLFEKVSEEKLARKYTSMENINHRIP